MDITRRRAVNRGYKMLVTMPLNAQSGGTRKWRQRRVPGSLAGVRVLDLTQFEAGPPAPKHSPGSVPRLSRSKNPQGGEAGRSLLGRQSGPSQSENLGLPVFSVVERQ